MIGYKLMMAFEGEKAPERIWRWLAERPLAGFTLFRHLNVRSPGQVRGLVDELQRGAKEAGRPPLIIAADQEGGQLMALGEGTTPFPGNMALAAVGDTDLTFRVGRAMGQELAAMGVGVNYAPNCDINSNPHNPTAGVRTFGDDASLTAQMAAAMISGLQSAGVAGTMKHFPGSGLAAVDAHYQMPLIERSREELEQVELLPFRAAISAGVKLAMSGHFAIPSLTGDRLTPATLSQAVMDKFLRDELGFEGLTISDALDMGAITQGAGQIIDVVAAVRAGVDLLLLTADEEVQDGLYSGLDLAARRGLIDKAQMNASVRRILAFKQWLGAQTQPGLDVILSAAHQSLAQEAAERSLTLLRNDHLLLPLQPADDAHLAVFMPRPHDLTPADSSSFVQPTLAASIAAYHPHVDEFLFDPQPTAEDIAALRLRAQAYDLLIVGTIAASMDKGQAALVNELLNLGKPVVTAAMRTPYDLAVYDRAATHVCTYSILQPSMRALAGALWGQLPFHGRLPVTIKGIAALGYSAAAHD